MKNLFRPHILPWFTLGAGGVGLALRIWLYANVDEKGLLPTNHPAALLIYILTALVFIVLFLSVRQLRPMTKYARLFPAGIGRAVGCAAGAAGILSAALFRFFNGAGVLGILTVVIGAAAAISLAYTAFLRLKGRRPFFLLHAVLTVFLMLYTVCQCQIWGSEPEVQAYFFPLLACIALMLTGYYLSVLDTRRGSRQWLVFFDQAALFCCCLSLNGENRLFYLGMAVWLTLDLCSVEVRPAPIARPPEEAEA